MTREEVLLTTRTKLQEIGLPKMKSEVGKAFFEMDQVVEALYIALVSGLNIILHGPGGFGKTQVVKEFLKVAGLSHSTIVGYEDMEVDGLLGVVNIKKLTEEATYEIAFEKSVFANPGILILEEFLDARPSTAAALKDILTEGGYRRGSLFVESLISSVIICTNKSPDELSNSLSTSAFYKERFPIVINVSWTKFDAHTYLRFLQHIKPEDAFLYQEEFHIIAELAARTSMTGNIVSPRIIKYAADLFAVHKDLSCLKNLAGLDTSSIDEVRLLCKSRSEKQRLLDLIANVNTIIAEVSNKDSYSVLFINSAIGKLDYTLERLDGIPMLDTSNFYLMVDLRKKCVDARDEMSRKLTKHLSDDDRLHIDKMFEKC
jgi:MoxR-like ATPase